MPSEDIKIEYDGGAGGQTLRVGIVSGKGAGDFGAGVKGDGDGAGLSYPSPRAGRRGFVARRSIDSGACG